MGNALKNKDLYLDMIMLLLRKEQAFIENSGKYKFEEIHQEVIKYAKLIEDLLNLLETDYKEEIGEEEKLVYARRRRDQFRVLNSNIIPVITKEDIDELENYKIIEKLKFN